jgi:hypothetical protein
MIEYLIKVIIILNEIATEHKNYKEEHDKDDSVTNKSERLNSCNC